jgi:hypothetical protein
VGVHQNGVNECVVGVHQNGVNECVVGVALNGVSECCHIGRDNLALRCAAKINTIADTVGQTSLVLSMYCFELSYLTTDDVDESYFGVYFGAIRHLLCWWGWCPVTALQFRPKSPRHRDTSQPNPLHSRALQPNACSESGRHRLTKRKATKSCRRVAAKQCKVNRIMPSDRVLTGAALARLPQCQTRPLLGRHTLKYHGTRTTIARYPFQSCQKARRRGTIDGSESSIQAVPAPTAGICRECLQERADMRCMVRA